MEKFSNWVCEYFNSLGLTKEFFKEPIAWFLILPFCIIAFVAAYELTDKLF